MQFPGRSFIVQNRVEATASRSSKVTAVSELPALLWMTDRVASRVVIISRFDRLSKACNIALTAQNMRDGRASCRRSSSRLDRIACATGPASQLACTLTGSQNPPVALRQFSLCRFHFLSSFSTIWYLFSFIFFALPYG